MSSAYGLHKAAGGFRARWRKAWADLPTATCKLVCCYGRAAGIVEGLGGPAGYVCDIHIPRARQLGYTVYTDPSETS